ncbi:MAG: hypothetical protein K0Q46_2521 [Rhodococcus erythropolis]|jgi:hypothetical protein|nr:hypothetical protein [Rhodococcus erythropolis]MDF2895735.1 hypothetical protein [Rhodococcus erythropolis]
MTRKPWPTNLTGGNMFTLAKCDPEAAPEATVITWANVFAQGGSIVADVKVTASRDDGTTYTSHVPLASIHIDSNRGVSAERKHLQGLVDAWNENRAENWRELVTLSREKVRAYEQERARAAVDKLARIESGDWS